MNYKFNPLFIGAALFCLVCCCYCTKPTPFGADLLNDQTADFDGQEITVNCTVEPIDSLITVDYGGDLVDFPYFLCGQNNDAEFGASTASIYAQLLTLSSAVNFTGATFDSIVLVLPYVAEGFYGDTMTAQSLKIYQLADTIGNSVSYISSNAIPVAQEIGSVDNLYARPRTKIKFIDSAANSTPLPYIKVRLSDAFGQQLMGLDSLTMTSKEDFNFFRLTKGIKIASTTTANPGAIMAFNLRSSSCRMRLYYTVRDTIHRSFDYVLNGRSQTKFMQFTHDYTGTPAQASVGVLNPPLIYQQGTGGFRIKLEFPDAAALDNVIINKAELQMYAISDPYWAVGKQMIVLEKNDAGKFFEISDVAYSRATLSNSLARFGGKPLKVGTVEKYQFSLTKKFQDIVDNKSTDPNKRTIYINLDEQVIHPNRTIIYGPGDANFPLKVRIKFTKL